MKYLWKVVAHFINGLQNNRRHLTVILAKRNWKISINNLMLEGTHINYGSSGLEGLIAVTTWSF